MPQTSALPPHGILVAAMKGGFDPNDTPGLLKAWGQGDRAAGDELIGVVYKELRRLAAHYLQTEREGQTLQPTALVHELYLKLFSGHPVPVNDREHFLALAARQLRRIVVDHARSRNAQKRGGAEAPISLDEARGLAIPANHQVIDLDLALQRLEELDGRSAQVVELRYFGGLTDAEVAQTLGVSLATVKRDWDFARSWLLTQLT